jgi:UDPglucose 6-dehydrogenase
MKIGIVGFGFVGRALFQFFKGGHQVWAYDKHLASHNSEESRVVINRCDLTFVAVPTPTGSDGMTCDLSAVEEVFTWLRTPACVKSTIPPGTVDQLTRKFHIPVAFSPEYIGERPGHEWKAVDSCGYVIIGGSSEICELVMRAYSQVKNASLHYHCTNAKMAELCKYMENCFLATKVAFVNQFFDIAQYLDLDFSELRELWLLDRRVGESHTVVNGERGFGGRCLPKDMKATIAFTDSLGGAPLLQAVVDFNEQVRGSGKANDTSTGDNAFTPTPIRQKSSTRSSPTKALLDTESNFRYQGSDRFLPPPENTKGRMFP